MDTSTEAFIASIHFGFVNQFADLMDAQQELGSLKACGYNDVNDELDAIFVEIEQTNLILNGIESILNFDYLVSTL